jgi:hypothetical protein
MTLLIIPILIEIAAGALEKGMAEAITRWSAGNIIKEYVATKIAEKTIEEGRKLAVDQADRWQSSFKKDPGESMRDTASALMQAKDPNAPDVNPDLVTNYRQQLIQQVGQEVVSRAGRGNYGQENTILDFDRDAVANRAVDNVLSRGLALAEGQDNVNPIKPLDQPLNGKIQGVSRGRPLSTYADNPAEDEEIFRTAARSAFEETFDEQELTRTIVGTDSSVQNAVQQPVEEMTAEAFDIDQPMS